MDNTTNILNIGGYDITNYLIKLLKSKGFSMTSESQELEAANDLKQRLCYVSDSFDDELKTAETNANIEKLYELPDGQILTVRNERFSCTEILFKPSIIDKEYQGIHKLVYQSIMSCDIDIRKDLYENIILSGATTLFPGYDIRMVKELTALAPASIRVRLVAPPERKYSVWIGGSILASLSTFQEMWVTRSEYDEYGSNIVHRKCF